ncbi:MAG: matrixin family metalloprotease [Vicinamibacteria bacterium]
MVRAGETRLALWPDTPAFPGEYTKALVYTDSVDGSLAPMRRLPNRVRAVAVQPSAELQADPAALDALRQAVDGIDAALAGRGVSYALGGAGDLAVPVRVDPADSGCAGRRATTWIWLGPADEIQRAEVVACSADVARNAGSMAHELVHTFGLRHSSDARDLMYALYSDSRSTTPTAREALAMWLVLERRTGTTWPDDDRDTQAQSRRVEVIAD